MITDHITSVRGLRRRWYSRKDYILLRVGHACETHAIVKLPLGCTIVHHYSHVICTTSPPPCTVRHIKYSGTPSYTYESTLYIYCTPHMVCTQLSKAQPELLQAHLVPTFLKINQPILKLFGWIYKSIWPSLGPRPSPLCARFNLWGRELMQKNGEGLG